MIQLLTEVKVSRKGPERCSGERICQYGVPLRVSSTLICICFSVFVQFTFFTMPLTKHSTEERMYGLRK